MTGHDRRMSDTEAMMWRLEKDPYLASTFANISILDRSPDMDTLCARMERTAVLFPRLRRRVQPAPGNLGNPTWVDDSEFDIRYHVRRISIPEPGTIEQLEQLVTLLMADPFDRSRPLWQFIVVDGLQGGRSALVEKLHHTVTDGQGGIELSMHFLDLERTPAPLAPLERDLTETLGDAASTDATEALRDALNDSLRLPLALLRQVRDVVSDPGQLSTIGTSTSATVRSILAQLSDTDSARSPLWTSRSLKRRIDVLRVPYASLRSSAKNCGGTLNTGFVTAIADAAGAYHREMGAPVESLRASMAISTRTETSGGNAFSLARMLVPTGEMPLQERFSAINEILNAARAESASANLDAIATISSVMPTSVITRLARAQAETVDFATSNVRGAGVPLFIAGAKLLANYPVGPLAGVALNVTVMSYLGSMDVGVHIDEAAVEHPEVLVRHMSESFDKLCSLADAPGSSAGLMEDPSGESPPPPPVSTPSRRRWWQRSR